MSKRGFKDEIRDCFPRNKNGIAIPINIDFDGTLVYHGYDAKEDDFKTNGRGLDILKRWINDYNCKVNIYTTREGEKLMEALRFCQKNDLKYSSINRTLPWQRKWSESSKQYGFVIDDMSCCKIFYDENGRATVDWEWVEENFEPRLKHMKEIIEEIEYEESENSN